MDGPPFFSEEGYSFDPTLASSQHFPALAPGPLSNTAPHDEDTIPQFYENLSWLNNMFDFEEMPPDGLEANDIPSGNSHSNILCPQNLIPPKFHGNGQGPQTPHPTDHLSFQNPNPVHSRGMLPWEGFPCSHRIPDPYVASEELDRAAEYGNSSAYDSELMLSAHMPPFHGLRGGNNMNGPLVPYDAQFTAADLGTLPQNSNADDTTSLVCSQTSCNSKCLSSVCEDDECSATGIPCDDPTCVEDCDVSQMMGPAHQLPTHFTPGPISFYQPHTQPCNHTESEHLVARTLGELRAPADSSTQEKDLSHPISLYPTLASRTEEQLFTGSGRLIVSRPPSTDIEDSTPNTPYSSLQEAPSAVAAAPQPVHACHWITNPDAPQGEWTTCGAQFIDTDELHSHICGTHVEKLTSLTKYPCLWEGCSRKAGNPFLTRGKLRRHIATHSAFKPHICTVCNQGFSGLQALQQHQRTHTGEKPFKCPHPGCTSAFKQKSALTMHIRTHTGEKPLHCEICGKAFPESSNLSKHRKIHSQDSKRYTCDELVNGQACGKLFRRLDQLRRHQATHLNSGGRRGVYKRRASVLSNISEAAFHVEQTATTTTTTTRTSTPIE